MSWSLEHSDCLECLNAKDQEVQDLKVHEVVSNIFL